MTNGVGPVSRRAFLHAGATLALLGTAPAAWARGAAAASPKSLRRSHFAPLLGAKLRMTGGGVDVDVVLAEVGNLVPVLRKDDPNRFALLFEAPRNHTRTEGIRSFHHDQLGSVALFVSPVDRGVKARHYEAVINRSRS